MHLLEERIRLARQEGRLARIPFLTAGFPDKDAFWDALGELDQNGADIIEIGVPFSDPVADGPVIEAASRKALENGATLAWLLRKLAARKGKYKAGLVLMGYYNPFLQYGLGRLAEDARAAGVHGFIVPDLPHEEQLPMRTALKREGIALIALVGPNTSPERMEKYASEAEGYIYVVSVLGTTGGKNALSQEVEETLARAKTIFSLPVALGFGITVPEQMARLSASGRPDAVIFGSALIRHLASGGSAGDFMKPWLA